MLNREELKLQMEKRLRSLETSQICALFFISVEQEGRHEADGGAAMKAAADRASALLARFFKEEDLVGCLGNSCFAALMCGKIKRSRIWEKASTLSRAVSLTGENVRDGGCRGYVGVYLFLAGEGPLSFVLQQGEYALRMARKNGDHHFFLYTAPEIEPNYSSAEEIKSQRKGYRECWEWLRFVTMQTDKLLWEVDLDTRVFRLLYTKSRPKDRPAIYRDFPESLIECGRVHRDSREDFARFGRGLLAGRDHDGGRFVIQYGQTGCYGWSHLSYQMLYDEEGHPEKAIGMTEYLSGFPDRQIFRRQIPADLYPHLYCFLQVNLSRNLVERCIMENGERREDLGRSYENLISLEMKNMFSASDIRRFQDKFSRSQLFESAKGGRHWLFDRFRLVDSEGMIREVSAGVNLIYDMETRDLIMFSYLSSRSQQQEWEKELSTRVHVEPETGIYEADTAEELACLRIREGGGRRCAVAELHIEGGHELFGEAEPQAEELDIMTAFHIFLDTDCIVGRKDAHSLRVFFPNAPSKAALRRRLENVFSLTRISMEEDARLRSLRFVAGVVCQEGESAQYYEMAGMASWLCRLHGSEIEDGVFFYGDAREYCWTGYNPDMKEEELEMQYLPKFGELTDLEKNVMLECMGKMLEADQAEGAIRGVMKLLGQYYQADRIYILNLTQNNEIVTMTDEWFSRGKFSIQESVSGKRTEHFPVLSRYVKHPEPICLSMKGEQGTPSWYFYLYPMRSGEDGLRVLCLENPAEHQESMALIRELVPYLGREKERFASREEGKSTLDRLYALPNLRSYMDAIYSLDSDQCSSLGVLTADIPDLGAIKQQRGYEFGSRFLLRMSEVLMDVFGSSMLFHVQDAEFIVLCLNITYEAFFNQCLKVRQLLGKNYTDLFRTGYTWSDQVFKGRDLVRKARSMMKCIGSGQMTVMGGGNEWDRMISRESIRSKFAQNGRLTIYFQPKIDMRTGSLAGAEALVRIQDEKGGLLPHGRVIEWMEQNGTIQELDYFVFNEALKAMSRWKRQGRRMIPLSSNFSRNTLLNPSALASVLAISSRYPEVPQDMIEMEITETAGDVENYTFSEMIEKFGSYGFRFSLDDFGSSYSNVAMLTNLKFHSVKLDRSIIKNISENKATRMLVKDIIKLCGAQGTICIAEGVENKSQEETLLENGCVYAQGFYYDRPMPLSDFEQKYLPELPRVQRKDKEEPL